MVRFQFVGQGYVTLGPLTFLGKIRKSHYDHSLLPWVLNDFTSFITDF